MEIEATNLVEGHSTSTDFLYFTGGLFARPLSDGSIALYFLFEPGKLKGARIPSWRATLEIAKQCGSRFVGTNQVVEGDSAVPCEWWHPGLGRHHNGLLGADCWSAIASQAHDANDERYVQLSRYLSVSMHLVGMRIRELAVAHHLQLKWAMQDGQKDGARFSNIALMRLYLAFHSTATELCSARDYLASIAALHIGESLDSLARLAKKLREPKSFDARNEPLCALLMRSWETRDSPGWLWELGELRNTMVHRQPMAANPEAAFLRLSTTQTPAGRFAAIRLSAHRFQQEGDASVDPFETLLDHYNSMERLVREASDLAKYGSVLPSVRVVD